MANQASADNTAQNNATADELAPEKSLLEVTLEGAIALTKGNGNIDQANIQFNALLKQIETDSPNAAPLLNRLWKEYVSAQRSATFFESLSDAEKDLSDKMSESTIQLQRNYMRLIQEQ